MQIDVEKKILKYLEDKDFLSVKAIGELNDDLRKDGSQYRIGRVLINQTGPAFIRVSDELNDIKVEHHNLKGAVKEDTVLITIFKGGKGRTAGKVKKIINRKINNYVGVYYNDSKGSYIELEEARYQLNIHVPLQYNKEAVSGHIVVVKLIGKKGKFHIGEIIKILGHANDVKDKDIISSIYSHGFEIDFPKEVIEEVKEMPSIVREEDIGNRKDLRDQCAFTIDGDDAKDLDDAVSVDVLSNGNYKLYVHVADVSHYVKRGSKLYEEAYSRGTSLYLVDRVVPMLPHKLSNGICSLNENEDRLAMTCEMEIDKEGNVVNYDIYKSVIRSKKRMTYNNVNKILAEKVNVEGYEKFAQVLYNLENLAYILRRNKEKRGFLNFDNPELKPYYDEKGNLQIGVRELSVGENIIEDCMVVANETVAQHFLNNDLPSVYRVHNRPQDKKIREFLELVAKTGHKLQVAQRNFDSKTIQKTLESFQEMDPLLRVVFSRQLLRKMTKAEYSSNNNGHFGLGSKCYTHFTSPIRRFPDLKVHELLKTYDQLIHKKELKRQTRREADLLPSLCEHSSMKEVAANHCGWDVDDMKIAEYMKERIGCEFEGIIADMDRNGLYILLNNLIEGRVNVRSMPDGYNFDEPLLEFKGSGPIYRIGNRVLVEVVDASVERRHVDFKIIRNIEARSFEIEEIN